ncbi:MAG: chorismate synthase [Alphaproteobacteria bacterium]
MSGNFFGTLFKFGSFGESHGKAIGGIVDGVPPLIPLSEEDIQYFLDRRKPGQSAFTTPRNEEDKVILLSGIFEGKTTGTPIGFMIENQDQRSRDYGDIAELFRPGHADYTYFKKYGIRDYRGGGRSSARETAVRVVAGAIARKALNHICESEVIIRGAVTQIGKLEIERKNWDWEQVAKNPFNCPDAKMVSKFEKYLTKIAEEGSSVGAVIELEVLGIPCGLGAPVYDKLDADIAKAMMSINAVKAVEIGEGFGAASLEGTQNADEFALDENGKTYTTSNHAGGILGGISTGEPITVRIAVKPTSSIRKTLQTIDINGKQREISTKGRHDPCVGIRAVPVAEAMLACVLLDHYMRHKAQCL